MPKKQNAQCLYLQCFTGLAIASHVGKKIISAVDNSLSFRTLYEREMTPFGGKSINLSVEDWKALSQVAPAIVTSEVNSSPFNK